MGDDIYEWEGEPGLQASRFKAILPRSTEHAGVGVTMVMIGCPECGARISAAAKSCPTCGLPAPFRVGQTSTGTALCTEPMSLEQAVRACFRKYAVFSGRARRAEFWWFVLFVFICNLCADVLDGAIGASLPRRRFDQVADFALFGPITKLGFLLPNIAVLVRRMHDKDLRGWWGLIPVYGVVLAASEGTTGSNRYGPDPKGREIGDGQSADSPGSPV